MLKMTPTQEEYHFSDASGYEFTVTTSSRMTTLGGRVAWDAEVTIRTAGLISSEAAVEALQPAVEQFLRQLKRATK